MKRIYGLYKIRKAAVSIGIFDGVHCGHQRILKKLVREALKEKTKSLVITFHPHPRKVLNPNSKIPLLTSLEHRLNLIEDLGVNFSLIIKFTKSISRMDPNDFIEKVLIHKFDIKALVVGKNFLFGYKGKGNFILLKRMANKFGFRLYGVKPVKIKGRFISSTRIRRAIEKGDLKNASLMLGRPVTVLGSVIKGRRIGRRLGFPTANIDPHHEAIPPSGVYAVDVKIHKRLYPVRKALVRVPSKFSNGVYKGILNIGIKPTFGRDIEQTLELHILNFKKDIYAKDVEIIFKRKIRNERKFPTVEALRKQIDRDILRAK